MTYEPYLSTVRAKPDAGKILDDQGLPGGDRHPRLPPDFIQKNPKVVKAVADSFFEALDMIKREPQKSYEIMGGVVKQTGEQFGSSAAFITWTDRAANKAYYARESTEFIEFAATVLKSNRVIEKVPSAKEMVDLRFQ